jgi:hypothetical protein
MRASSRTNVTNVADAAPGELLWLAASTRLKAWRNRSIADAREPSFHIACACAKAWVNPCCTPSLAGLSGITFKAGAGDAGGTAGGVELAKGPCAIAGADVAPSAGLAAADGTKSFAGAVTVIALAGLRVSLASPFWR